MNSMAMASIVMLVYQRVYPISIPLNHYKIPLNHYKSHSCSQFMFHSCPKKKIGKILRATVVPVAWSLMRVPGCRGGNVGATLLALFQHQYPDWLVVSTPLKNMKVSWDDDIPNWMESHKNHVPNYNQLSCIFPLGHLVMPQSCFGDLSHRLYSLSCDSKAGDMLKLGPWVQIFVSGKKLAKESYRASIDMVPVSNLLFPFPQNSECPSERHDLIGADAILHMLHVSAKWKKQPHESAMATDRNASWTTLLMVWTIN